MLPFFRLPRLAPAVLPLLLISRIACAEPDALALPQAPSVTDGLASVSGSDGNLTVTQTTERAVIEWQSFDIGRDASVTFDQQAGNHSVAVNHVTGGADPTKIMGRLSANGTVVILDANGVVFGPDAVIDVGGIVAATGRLADKDAFMNGQRFALTETDAQNPAAAVHNLSRQFTVRDGGIAAFVAPVVRNDGVITARLGNVTLAAVRQAAFDFYGDGLLYVAAGETGAEALAGQAAVENSGTIIADGGTVRLTARAAAGIVDNAINTTGLISAQYASARDGKIILSAAPAQEEVHENTILVGKDASIQSAIDLANADGTTTIAVQPGEYNENLVIDRPLTLRGRNGELPILVANADAPAITVTASDVSIEYLFIGGGLHNVFAQNVSRLSILSNQLHSSVSDALHLAGTTATRILDNFFFLSGKNGIYLASSANADIQRNYIQSSISHGIQLIGARGAKISGNTILLSGGSGIYLADSIGAEIQDNNIYFPTAHGLHLYNSSDTTQMNNTILAALSGIDVFSEEGLPQGSPPAEEEPSEEEPSEEEPSEEEPAEEEPAEEEPAEEDPSQEEPSQEGPSQEEPPPQEPPAGNNPAILNNRQIFGAPPDDAGGYFPSWTGKTPPPAPDAPTAVMLAAIAPAAGEEESGKECGEADCAAP